jgi:hypothetical protein
VEWADIQLASWHGSVFLRQPEVRIETLNPGVTANVRTEGVSENILFWDVFKDLLVTQSVLHQFE